jgi:hypothetical protein
MKRLASRIGCAVLGFASIELVGCNREPIPDHLGLFAVTGHELRELPKVPGADEHSGVRGDTPSEEIKVLEKLDLDAFSKLFSASSALPTVPEYFILYDSKFNPGDLHLYNLAAPRWQSGRLALDVGALELKIEPLEKSPGMYRLRPVTTLFKDRYYVLTGRGESATGTAGYLRPFCPLCDLISTQGAIAKVRDEEAARIRQATTATKTVSREKVRVAPYGMDYYCTTCFWDVTVTDVDITWTRDPNRGVYRARYADLQRIYWDPHWSCLKIPPLENSVCALQTSSSDEGKLQAIAVAANAALMEWRRKYPGGLPYAEGPVGD